RGICWSSQRRVVGGHSVKSQVGSFGNNFNNRTEEAIGRAKKECLVAERCQKTGSGTWTPIKYEPWPRAGWKESNVLVNGNQPHNFKLLLAGRRGDVHFVPYLAIQKGTADRGGR